MSNSIPSINEFKDMFPNNRICMNFLLSNNVFYTNYLCPHCNQEMNLDMRFERFKCNRTNCFKKGSTFSLRIGTFFYHSKLNCLQILSLAHLWLSKCSVETAEILSGQSHPTISTFYKHFRQLVTSALSPEDEVIGGPGIEVSVDETKLGKRKYNRGHPVDGVWVVVGIEKRINGKIFMVPVEDRSASSLTAIIQKHVVMGSTICTDMWRGYSRLEDLGYNHITVNHSVEFVDSVTGACTNNAEGLNSGIKRRIQPRNRTRIGIENHLGEYIWRRQNKYRLFEALIDGLRDVHYEL